MKRVNKLRRHAEIFQTSIKLFNPFLLQPLLCYKYFNCKFANTKLPINIIIKYNNHKVTIMLIIQACLSV